MAGNKRRAARPEGITGAAAARVPARYDAASVRDVRSAQRPGGSKKRKTGTGSRTVQRTSRNSRYEQDERRRPSGRSPQAQRVQREPRQDVYKRQVSALPIFRSVSAEGKAGAG